MFFSPIAFTAVLAGLVWRAEADSNCKCGPSDDCWPSSNAWNTFNSSLSGKLILNTPVAQSCYPGPQQDAATCAAVDAQWSNATFQSNDPSGLSYPVDITCYPVNATAGQTPGTCSIGDIPRYTVNATVPEDVAAAVKFAKKHNIRVVIKDTGHDILGRSTGYGSLEIWIRHLRTGINFQDKYKSPSGCKKSNWTGSTFSIGGGYTWKDVYPLAQSKNVVVVGGGTPVGPAVARIFGVNADYFKTVGCLGGWMQGGGHGPASHEYGLGADQLLEATVVVADGSIVTASPCEHSDLYFAIRGGGGGTYGVVVSATVKAHPNNKVVAQHLAIVPLTTNISAFYDVIATVWASYPDLNDAGYAGYGQWAVDFPVPLFSTFTTGYVHGIYVFGKSLEEAQTIFAPTAAKLKTFNGTSAFVSVSYVSYPSYWDFYQHESGVEPPVGSPGALGSRLFDRAALTGNPAGLRKMMSVIAGTPGQGTSNNFELVSGGQVFKDASDPYSGLNPAWRTSYMNNIVALILPTPANESVIAAAYNDVTYTKVAAMNAQAPNTGVYMNEGDRLDPNYKENFYGTHYPRLLSIKKFYDPGSVFYCPTCVGSGMWKERADGTLCMTSTSTQSNSTSTPSSGTSATSSGTSATSGGASAPSSSTSAKPNAATHGHGEPWWGRLLVSVILMSSIGVTWA